MSSLVPGPQIAAPSLPVSQMLQFFRASSDPVFLTGPNLEVIEWNQPLERLTGFLNNFVLGKNLTELLPDLAPEEVAKSLSAVTKGQESSPVTFALTLPDSRKVSCKLYLMAAANTENNIAVFAGLIKVASSGLPDKQNQVEQEIIKSKLFATKVAEAALCIITVFDLQENQHVYSNNQLENILGYTKEEINEFGPSFFQQLIHPEDVKLLDERIALIATLPDGQVKELECRVKDKKGVWRWFQVRGSVFSRTTDGKAARLLAVLIEIEQHARAKQMLTNMLSNSQVGILALDEVVNANGDVTDFRLTFLNDSAMQMLQLNSGSASENFWSEVLNRVNGSGFLDNYLSVVKTGTPLVFEQPVSFGATITWLSVSVSRSEMGVNVSLTDIGNSNSAAQKLSESHDFIRKVADATPMLLLVYDSVSDQIVFSNRAANEITIRFARNLEAPNYTDFLNFSVHPEDLADLKRYQSVNFAKPDNQTATINARFVQPDGSYRWCVLKNNVFKSGASGEPILFISVIQDIDELKRNKNMLKGVLNQSLNMILAFEAVRDQEGKISDFTYLHANATSERFTGIQPEELAGASLRSYMTDSLAEERFIRYVKVVETGRPTDFEQYFNLPNGPVWFHISAVKMADGFVATFTDITERKRALSQLSESQQFISKITDTAPFIITVYDLENQKYIFRNRKLQELLGFSSEELVSMPDKSLIELIHPEDLARVPEHHQKLQFLPDGEVAEFPFRACDKSGNYRHLIARDTVFRRNPDGSIASVLGVSQDVNDLQRNKDLLASVLDTSLSGIAVLKAKRNASGEITNFVYVLRNKAAEHILGEIETSEADSFLTTWPLRAQDSLFGMLVKVIENGQPLHLQYYFHPVMEQWLEVHAARLEDSVVFTYTNVTQRKEAEDKVRKSEALLSQAQQIANLGIWEWDVVNDAIYWSDTLYEMFEVDRSLQNICLNTYLEILEEESRVRIKNIIEKSQTTGEGFTFPHKIIFGDGRVKHLVGKGRMLFDAEDKPLRMLGTVMDITELIEIRQQLNDVLQIKSLGEAIPQIIWTARADGYTDYVNQRWFEFTGLDEAKMLSGEWTQLIHPQDAARTWWQWKKSLVTGKVFELEFRMRRQDGQYRWLLGRAVPMTDETGKIINWFGASTDIDDQKKTMEEMELIQDAMSHYNRELSMKNTELSRINSDLDNFIYTASHDLKAPISNIEGLLDLLKSEVKTESDIAGRIFDLMQNSIGRFKNTLKELTEISKTDRYLTDTESLVHLPDLMDEIEADIEQLIKESKAVIRFNLEVKDLLYSRKNIRSILYNLLSNALKYRSPDRTPEIQVTSQTPVAGHLEITVSDNGLGLDEKDTDRVFEMFRRAHSHVEGSGVGLYIVKRIVENSGGSISVTSSLGQGTEFKVLLKQ